MGNMPYNKTREFTAEFYETEEGRYPAEEFLRSLDKKMMAKMYGMLEILEEKGNRLREPYSKYMGGGIFELRAKTGSDVSRVLYFFYSGGRIVLTNGFVKKSRKTPKRELERAKTYRKDYLRRKGIEL